MVIFDISDSIRNIFIRRPWLFYRCLIFISLFGSLLALISMVRNRAKIDRTSDHLANFRPVYGFDGDISTISLSSSKNNAQFVAKYSSLIDKGVGTSINYNFSGLFSKLDAQKPYEIKSCLSPDLQVHEEATCRFFAIMMDAGSTGTRVHIFEFSHNVHDNSAPFKLEREIYDSVSPGLSSYLADPSQAANSILPLLRRAESVVSKSQWVHTPLALKATAGLRLLDAPKADAIIEKVDNMFDATSFLTNEDSVSIMTGIDEGIFGWFTLNFLLERLSSIKYEQFNEMIDDNVSSSTINPSTAAALDLGGGSTQITFKPKWNITLQTAPTNYIKQIRLFSKTIDIYTHSYLGNGLMASRLQSLQLANEGMNGSNTTHFVSSCLPPNFSLLWMYNDVMYNVSGSTNYNFDNCLQEQTNFTNKTLAVSPIELKAQDIYIFGYFFDRANQAGLTGTNGGYATVTDFIRAAKKACIKKKLGRKADEQWKCRDLSYIIALLRAYGVPDKKPFHLTKKIRNMEVSWALGASYHLLNTYHESKKAGSPVMRPYKKGDSKFSALSPLRPLNSSSTPCPCDDLVLASGGALNDIVLNFTAAFICSRLYYGILNLLPSTIAQFA